MEIGVDIIELERIGKAWNHYGEAFLKRFLTSGEIDYCLKKRDPVPSIAGRFAAKEALVKAMGTGISGPVHWKSFEVINDSLGKPVVHIHGMVAGSVRSAQVSISHDRHSAVAMAMVVRKETGIRY